MAMSQITDKIFLGSFMALSGQRTFEEKGITHILSLLSGEVLAGSNANLYSLYTGGYKKLKIDIDDVEDENIMQYFAQTNDFINSAVTSGGKIFVHCMAGVSRSTTAVCAYLMSQNLWSAQEAIAFVKARRPVANPNDSFKEQLQVYYECAYQVSDSQPPYRLWQLKTQAEEIRFTRQAPQAKYASTSESKSALTQPTYKTLVSLLFRLDANALKQWNKYRLVSQDKTWELTDIPIQEPTAIRLVAQEPDLTPEFAVSSDVLAGYSYELRCRKCRSALATSAFVVTHDPPADSKSPHDCSFFVEPLKWMSSELEQGKLEGKLACPKCSSKVGIYHWQGSKCSCGTWVTPAISLQRARIDKVTKHYTRPKA